jgi:hypothetical protein
MGVWILHGSDLWLGPTWGPAHLLCLRARWARCSSFARESRGTLINKGAGKNESEVGRHTFILPP